MNVIRADNIGTLRPGISDPSVFYGVGVASVPYIWNGTAWIPLDSELLTTSDTGSVLAAGATRTIQAIAGGTRALVLGVSGAALDGGPFSLRIGALRALHFGIGGNSLWFPTGLLGADGDDLTLTNEGGVATEVQGGFIYLLI